MNNIRIYLIFTFAVSWITVHSQVTIGLDTAPEKAALLEIKSQDSMVDGGVTSSFGGGGLLLPRVLLTDQKELSPFIDKDNINPEEYGRQKKIYKGLVVYNLTESNIFVPGIYAWDGNQWYLASEATNVGYKGYWALKGNKGSDPVKNYMGTKDKKALILKTDKTERLKINETGNIGINNPDPKSVLEVNTEAKLNDTIFLKGLQSAPTGEDANISPLVRHSRTGRVFQLTAQIKISDLIPS